MTIACNLGVFDDSARLKYSDLAQRVRSSLIARSEISEGFVFELAHAGISALEITEWISMERRCCPFLSIQLLSSGDAGRFLTMTGPSRVKELILAEFPMN